VRLYDFGVTADGSLYYVMELLDGLDLETLVGRYGPMPVGRVVRIGLQACNSLAEAHAAGLIHRDIKPANLFLARQGLEADVLKLLDFGLVLRQSVAGDAAEGKLFAGTPAYLAPETLHGRGLDHRADMYSLGCVLYWLLSGETVFPVQDSAAKVLQMHLSERPHPPSARMQRPCPPELDALVLRCLEKQPERRFADASELRLAFAAIRIPASEAWTDDDARQWWSRIASNVDAPHAQLDAEAQTVVKRLDPELESVRATGDRGATPTDTDRTAVQTIVPVQLDDSA